MNGLRWWGAVRSRWVAAVGRRPRITLQHLMLTDPDLDSVRALLNDLSAELDTELDLQGHAGDAVLVDGELSRRISPRLMHSLVDNRPVIRVSGLQRAAALQLPASELQARQRQELLHQLRLLPQLRQRGAAAAAGAARGGQDYESGFDSQLDAAQLQDDVLEAGRRSVLQQALRGLHDPTQPLLTASYGPLANLHFDFRHRMVLIDPAALRQLRIQRELPLPALGAVTSDEATVRDLEVTLWDMGLASGRSALAGAPTDWWHTPLACASAVPIERLTRVPRQLEMARRLAARPMTPSTLRRQAQVGIDDLRRFLQAGLLLQLLHWAPDIDVKEMA